MHKVTARYSSLFCGLDCGKRRGGTDRLALVGLVLGDWQLVSWRVDARTAFSAFVSEGDVARFAKGLTLGGHPKAAIEGHLKTGHRS